MKPKYLILIIVGVVAIGAMLIVSNCSRIGETTQNGDVISITLSRANADAEVTYTISLIEGTDAAHEAAHIFETVDTPAVEKVSLNVSTLALTVAYDSSAITEAEIAGRLTEAGYAPR